jgi:hypothetical protein
MVSIWLTQQKIDELKKYACIVGLIGQPFWLISSYNAEQWGILALSVFYTYTWCLGLKNHWFVKQDA